MCVRMPRASVVDAGDTDQRLGAVALVVEALAHNVPDPDDSGAEE